MRCVRCKAADGGTRLCSGCRRELVEQQIDGSQVRELFEQAMSCFVQGDHKGAVPVLEALLRLDERNLGAYESLILALGRCRQYEHATATLAAMHHVHPAQMGGQGHDLSAPPSGGGVATATPDETGSIDLVNLGLFYRQFHHLDLAEKVLHRVLREDEQSAEAHLVLGSIYREKGHPKVALKHLRMAQAQGPETAAVLYEMGLCYEALRQVKKAHQLVSAAIALEPDNPHMHFSLGMLYEKSKRSKLARREYRVASSLNGAFSPALVDISFRLGLGALEEGHSAKALQEFQAGVRENPDLFAPSVMAELDHLVTHLIRGEQFHGLLQELPALRKAPRPLLRAFEDVFSTASRLAFFVGLSCYWDSYYEGQGCEGAEFGEHGCIEEGPAPPSPPYEPAEPEATWLEGTGPNGRVVRGATSMLSRSRRKRLGSGAEPEGLDDARREEDGLDATEDLPQGDVAMGLPPVPFEFVFEEWLNVQQRLSSKRVSERPLVSPDTYQRLIQVLGASLRRAQPLLARIFGKDETRDELDSSEGTEVATALWACIIESYLLRVALERCRNYPREFLARLAAAERYRQSRFFGRAIRELEAALPLLPGNASLRNFLWNLCIREGRYREAGEHCQEVLRNTAHYLFQAAAYNDLAYCMVEMGDNLNLALLYSEKARELVPRLFDAHVADTLAWLHFQQKDYDEALRLVEEVIRVGRSPSSSLTPTSVHYYHYGHILRALGREDEAQKAFSTALEMEIDAESDWGIARRMREDGERAG